MAAAAAPAAASRVDWVRRLANQFVISFDDEKQLSQADSVSLLNHVYRCSITHKRTFTSWLLKIIQVKNQLRKYIKDHYNNELTLFIQRPPDIGFFIGVQANGHNTHYKHIHFVLTFIQDESAKKYNLRYHLVSHVKGSKLYKKKPKFYSLKNPQDKVTIMTTWWDNLADTDPHNLGKKHSQRKHSQRKHSQRKHSQRKH